LEISTIKNRINSQILKAVKETAIDCNLYKKSHASEGLTCYQGYGMVKSNNFGSYPTVKRDIGEKMERNVEVVQVKLNPVTIKGKPYKMNIATREIYEEGVNKEMVLVGTLRDEKDENGKRMIRLSPVNKENPL
jgi:hypothetical protein